MLKKRLLIPLFVLALFVLGWGVGTFRGGWPIPLLAFFVLLAVAVEEIRLDRRRRRCIDRLLARPDVDPAIEYANVSTSHGVEGSDVERVWKALAKILELPCDKLRCADRLEHELYGCGDPDIDLVDGFSPRPPRFEFHRPATWGELVAEIIRVEKESGAVYTAES